MLSQIVVVCIFLGLCALASLSVGLILVGIIEGIFGLLDLITIKLEELASEIDEKLENGDDKDE